MQLSRVDNVVNELPTNSSTPHNQQWNYLHPLRHFRSLAWLVTHFSSACLPLLAKNVTSACLPLLAKNVTSACLPLLAKNVTSYSCCQSLGFPLPLSHHFWKKITKLG
jgi:hypothetical protein